MGSTEQFRVQGYEVYRTVQGSGFRGLQNSSGFRVMGFTEQFRVQGYGVYRTVQGSGFRVMGVTEQFRVQGYGVYRTVQGSTNPGSVPRVFLPLPRVG